MNLKRKTSTSESVVRQLLLTSVGGMPETALFCDNIIVLLRTLDNSDRDIISDSLRRLSVKLEIKSELILALDKQAIRTILARLELLIEEFGEFEIAERLLNLLQASHQSDCRKLLSRINVRRYSNIQNAKQANYKVYIEKLEHAKKFVEEDDNFDYKWTCLSSLAYFCSSTDEEMARLYLEKSTGRTKFRQKRSGWVVSNLVIELVASLKLESDLRKKKKLQKQLGRLIKKQTKEKEVYNWVSIYLA